MSADRSSRRHEIDNGSVPKSELSPGDKSRRNFLLGAGLLGAGAAASVLAHPGAASAAGLPHTHAPQGGGTDKGGFKWLAGDHHMPATTRLFAIQAAQHAPDSPSAIRMTCSGAPI
ncbi:hypothetical protein ACTI_32830 [Actinoplanes sp. OR16]|uniref:hypothetical protein n=1 Tax=Actinoplanes sp. OR16 TaxID=946334 RepID=UPI000F706B76|nr:hypothetical protein [Actinoplanes sp. OR16]BBH66598.1 hypothetical protein ACTI_32830 [Actinoplanes sp. OR16]